MNPLIELKERLVYIAVAGTQLIKEDFRLKKSIENFSALAEKNPVFKKIYTDLQTMMSAEKEEQVFLLLNILGLIDAVLYTQATSTVEGEVKDLPEYDTFGDIIQIRYSEINPLIEALTTTGSGRMEILQNTIINHPDFLTDYRIINALINDLCDPYGEMADLVYSVLEGMCMDKAIHIYSPYSDYARKSFSLPHINKKQLLMLLKKNFDPQGKKEMVKRLSLIISLAKEDENDWYLSLLDTAKKEVREVAISGLQYKKENISMLLEMVKKERGKAKEEVYKILSKAYTPDLFDFWKAEITKNPSSVQFLKYVKSDDISDLIADTFKEELNKYINQDNIDKTNKSTKIDITKTNIVPLSESLENKMSDKIFELYKWILENHQQMPKFQQGKNLLECLSSSLIKTLVNDYPVQLVNFLGNLNHEEQKLISYVCFISDIFNMSAAEFYDKWSYKEIWIYVSQSQLRNYFNHITVKDEEYTFYDWYLNIYSERTIKEPLDPRWFEFFMKHRWNEILSRFDFQGNEEQKKKIGEYFYNVIKSLPVSTTTIFNQTTTVSTAMRMMKKCEYNKFEGLILLLCRKHANISVWNLQSLFHSYKLYAGEELTQKEALDVLEYFDKNDKNGKIAIALKEMLINDGFLKV